MSGHSYTANDIYREAVASLQPLAFQRNGMTDGHSESIAHDTADVDAAGDPQKLRGPKPLSILRTDLTLT